MAGEPSATEPLISADGVIDYERLGFVPDQYLDEPEHTYNPILPLGRIRYNDSHRYGTKAANLGELHHVLEVLHEGDNIAPFQMTEGFIGQRPDSIVL